MPGGHLGQEGGAGEPDPLPGENLHVGWPVELDLEHVAGQQLSLQDVQLHVGGSEGDDLVQGIDNGGDEEVGPKQRSRGDSLKTVDDTQEVQENVELVNFPEERIGLSPNFWVSKYEDRAHCDPEDDSCYACQGLEQPIGDIWLLVAAEPELRAEAVEVV